MLLLGRQINLGRATFRIACHTPILCHYLPANSAHGAERHVLASVIQIVHIKSMDFTKSLLKNIRGAGGAGCLIRSICCENRR